jgi:hypothetical protein
VCADVQSQKVNTFKAKNQDSKTKSQISLEIVVLCKESSQEDGFLVAEDGDDGRDGGHEQI